MKFLVDENVPGRIVKILLRRYPGSISVAVDSRFSKERVLPLLSAATDKSLTGSLTIITKKSIRTKFPK